MIVFSAGMQKSGSGWYFNLTNDIMISAGNQDVRKIKANYNLHSILKGYNCNIGKITFYKLIRIALPNIKGASFVVKTHVKPTINLNLLINLGIVKATYIYRDPRDVVVSAFEHGERIRSKGENHTFAQFETIESVILASKKWLKSYEDWTRIQDTFTIKYEDLVCNPLKVMNKLIEFLEIEIPSESLENILNKYQKENLNYHKERYLHFNVGKIGRYKEIMTEDQLDLCNLVFNKYLKWMGYDETVN
jgi:hypothetical protein